MHLIIVIIIITLFKSQGYLAEHKCSTNWEDYKSTEIRRKSIQVLVFEERGTPRKLNPHVASIPRINLWPHWWQASALTTAPALLPSCHFWW